VILLQLPEFLDRDFLSLLFAFVSEDLPEPLPLELDGLITWGVNCSSGYDVDNVYGVLLSQTVKAILSLTIRRGAPRTINENACRSSSGGDTNTTRLYGGDKDTRAALLEVLYQAMTILRRGISSKNPEWNLCRL
jgi:hypothetical protein